MINCVDNRCYQIIYRVNDNSLQPGISRTSMTTMPSPTSTAICRAWFAGTSLPRRATWRRGRHVASEVSHLLGQVQFMFSLPRCWQSHVTPGRLFCCWQLTWNASNCFASPCRIVQASEPYIFASAYRMVQASKPCLHTDLTMHACATLINYEFWRQGETHIRLRSLIEAARPIRCIISGLQYPCDACFY